MKIKDALIVPGFGEQFIDNYENIARWFNDVGIESNFIAITWPRTIITQNIKQLNGTYKSYDAATTLLFGYSLGAMISLLAAADRSPKVLILMSMAPWFAEDIPLRSEYHKRVVGKQRLAAYKTTRFEDMADQITSKTYIFLGENEAKRWPAYLLRAEAAQAAIPDSELTVISHSEHSPNQQYMSALKDIIYSL